MTSTIRVDHEGFTARVHLDRPAQRNAFGSAMVAELTQAFTTLAQDAVLRVVVLSAEGPAFSAGADLNWMREMARNDWPANHADALALADMLWSIAHCPVPVVARVQGDCLGGGVGLVAACDIAVASLDAGFSLSEVKLGLIPATISPYVVRAMGERAARRYFVTAERIDATRAQALGLVHEVCAHDLLDDAVKQLADRIAMNSPQAVRASKQLIQDVAGQPLTAELKDLTARRIADARASQDGREGMNAFLNKTRPAWQTTTCSPKS